MSVTAVPLRPVPRSAIVWLWLALAVLAVTGGGIAWLGTRHVPLSAEAFLARNAKKPGVVTTASGLQYQVQALGSGVRPKIGDAVLVNYEGRLADGTLFDREGPVVMLVGQVVPGFTEALTIMPVGSRYRVWIPPKLGYPGGQGPIPPNTVMVFEIQLLAAQPVPRNAAPMAGSPQEAMPQQGQSQDVQPQDVPPQGAMPQDVPPQEAPAQGSPQ
jgi:FKBP-type peptidyl-prolyl cis-trans isomerase FkpA